MDELSKTNFKLTKYCSLEEIINICDKKGIKVYTYEDKITPGWNGKPKGLLQILWERGWINENELISYSATGKTPHKDDDGNVKDEFKKYWEMI